MAIKNIRKNSGNLLGGITMNLILTTILLFINSCVNSSKNNSNEAESANNTAPINSLNSESSIKSTTDSTPNLVQKYQSKKGSNASSVSIESCSPWGNINSQLTKKTNASATALSTTTLSAPSMSYEKSMLQGEHQFISFLIKNTDQQNCKFTISEEQVSPNFSLEIAQVPFVSTINNGNIADPIIPITDKTVNLSPGETKALLIKLKGIKGGTGTTNLNLNSEKENINIKITAHVIPLIKGSAKLNAVNWAYFDYPMLSDRKQEAITDLKYHKINTIVVHGGFIPDIGKYNFSRLKSYVSTLSFADKILLYKRFPVQKGNSGPKFMSPEWKNEFSKWYSALLKALQSEGISPQKVYYYPYDEIKATDLQNFKSFSTWAKASIPNMKIYVTILKEPSISAIKYADIAQISEKLLGKVDPSKFNSEIWSYSILGNARALSPYKDYRLMAWRAFLYDLKGIGFWNYADIGKNKKQNLITSKLASTDRDYSVIYSGENKGIISSRRWEAFSKGIEDYQVLSMYGRQVGMAKAKALAKEVCSKNDDPSLADKTIATMIQRIKQ